MLHPLILLSNKELRVKKKLIKIVGILLALIVIALVVVYMMLGSIIKKGVETVGPELTKGDVKLEGASLSIFGTGGVKGLEIGNPKNGDFGSPFAFKLGSTDVKVKIGSLTSDTIIVESIVVDGGLRARSPLGHLSDPRPVHKR